jgi:GTPase involved in cell partitioning and DNA repair
MPKKDQNQDDFAALVDEQFFSLSIADLPGIIEGASRNVGGGMNFLKHLEYSDIIVMVVDIHGFQLAISPEVPFRYFKKIDFELLILKLEFKIPS